MNTITERLAYGNSIWSRVIAFIKAYEDAQDTRSTERNVSRLNDQVADLSETLSALEARIGY